MTDRASVMKSFDKKRQDFLSSQLGQEITLHFLHCNAHFLLRLSRACEISLKVIEEDIKKRYLGGVGQGQRTQVQEVEED